MAEQCIVCLETLLHAGDPPPPPDERAPQYSTLSAAAAARESGPSTVPPAAEQNGQGAAASDDAAAAHVDDAVAAVDDAAGHNDDRVAVIEICGHTLHDTCLREWTGKANSCPICRQSFHLVHVYDKIGGALLSSYKVEDKKQVAEFDPQAWLDEYAEAEDEDVSTPCPVCNLADHEEVLLLCDGCDTPYHTHCIGLDSVPEGAWFCMECVDLLGPAIPTRGVPAPSPIGHLFSRRMGATARNDFFPRTRHTQRRARRRARSDEWQGAWGQITGRIWDALNIDLDHDEDEALEEFRRVERLRDNERREFERWQERLDIARRLGAQDVFERNIPSAILQHASRHGGSSQAPRAQPVVVQQTREERRAWGDLERARDCEVSTQGNRKRKARSITASPVEPPPEPERKLKRPRTRRIVASGDAPSSSKSTSVVPSRGTGASTSNGTDNGTGNSASNGASNGISNGTSNGTRSGASNGTSSRAAGSSSAASGASAGSPQSNAEPPSFLSSLLKEVEMSTPSDDENIRCLFGDSSRLPAVDPSSPVASSPAASVHNSPRALSTTPPPHRALRPSSPTLLSSHIEPIYPPANYSPTRAGSSPGGGGGGGGGCGDTSDSEGTKTIKAINNNTNNNNSSSSNGGSNHHRPPIVTELRQPRPRRMPAVALPRSQDASPTRASLSLEMKENISRIVRSALSPHWKSNHLTADQYAAINRDVSHKLYEDVTNPAAIDGEERRQWEQKASREVARAVSDLQA